MRAIVKIFITVNLLITFTTGLQARSDIPSDNAYLAVSMMNDFDMTMLYDTGDAGETFNCMTKEMARKHGIEKKCKEIARKMVENNVISLATQVQKDLKSCKQRVTTQTEDIEIISNPHSGTEYYLEFADVITQSDEVMSEISSYLQIAKIERGDRETIDEINEWVDMNFNNIYIDEEQRIFNIDSLSCQNLLFTQYTRREQDREKYAKFVLNTCYKVQELKDCNQALYKTTAKLRNVVEDAARNYNVKVPRNYLTLPKLKTFEQ